jgi:DNA-binding MurR/RpiR family transcriptional regulator
MAKTATTKPITDSAGLQARAAGMVETLSPQLRRAARYILANSDKVAVQTVRETAAAARVTPATVVRLAKSLGLNGYPELKRLFLDDLVAGARGDRLPYAAKAAELQKDDSASIYERLYTRQAANLEATRAANGAALLARSAAALAKSRRVWIAGFRSLYPLAYYLHYVWGFFRQDLFLAASPGGVIDNGVFDMGPRDALVVMTVSPYSRDAVAAAEAAHQAGATIVALSDSTLSPLAKYTEHLLVAATDTPSFFHSLTAASATIEALLATLAHRGGADALAAIARTQARLSAIGVYVDPPTVSRP